METMKPTPWETVREWYLAQRWWTHAFRRRSKRGGEARYQRALDWFEAAQMRLDAARGRA